MKTEEKRMATKFTRSEAEKYRQIINEAAKSLSDSEAAKAPLIFEKWEPYVDYEVGRRVQYNNVLYKVILAHQSIPSWTPDYSPSLFARVLIPDPSVIPEWIQPDSTNPYMIGDKVTHNGKTWVSYIDNNVWEPGVYGWNEVS